MKIYQLKVSLFGYHQQPINKLHRIITISENCTFEALHDIIYEAFDREEFHLYSFFLTKKDSKSMRDIMGAPCVTNPFSFEQIGYHGLIEPKNAAVTNIKAAKLNEKDVFHYWFDFGDNWWHRIRVQKISIDPKSKKAFAKITKKVGQSPAQYNYYYDDDDYDDDVFD